MGFNFQFVIFFSFFLFFIVGVSDMSEPCWCRVEEAKKKRKKEKKKETLLGHQSSVSHTSSGVRHVTNT